ncbi:hypothetical protein PybrP1_006624 [[Pythium] brassicae (nom. inval.)]|nr:hypothetical protein PybrP1_006624 [[Pythium] brassicae (nom. inval.)]
MLVPETSLDYQWGHAVNSRELLEGVKRGILRAVHAHASTTSEASNTRATHSSEVAVTAGNEEIHCTDHNASSGVIKSIEYSDTHRCIDERDARRISDCDAAARHDHRSCAGGHVNAIEADVIWSETQQAPVMGHPPQTDGDLSLADFLDEMQALATLLQLALQCDPRHQHGASDDGHGNDKDQHRDPRTLTPLVMVMSPTRTPQLTAVARTPQATSPAPLIVKLDFKSMRAFRASYDLLRAFVVAFPFSRGVFVNADILVGPANSSDIAFPDAGAFLELATALGDNGDSGAVVTASHAHKLVLSVGWTTANASEDEWRRAYSHDMVDAMLRALVPYTPSATDEWSPSATESAHTETLSASSSSASSARSRPADADAPLVHVTFPVRATSVRASWDALERLLRASPRTFGFTLWWAKTQLPDEELEWLFSTLESAPAFAARTFYDIRGFESFLQRRRRVVACEA